MTEAKIGNRDFWSARFARIYSLHLITLILAIPQELNNETDLPKVFNFLFQIGLTQSFVPLQSTYYSFNGVAWSISNEAYFYFMFPFLVLWQRKKAFISALIVSMVGLFIYTLATTISASLVEWVFKIKPSRTGLYCCICSFYCFS
jgi:peptidoglycan/LPS O-acetylase OafA/YrhL